MYSQSTQVLNSSNVVQQTWNFSSSGQSWQTTTSQIAGSSNLLSSYITPTQAEQTTSTTYFNDICIAAVQVLNSSNVVLILILI